VRVLTAEERRAFVDDINARMAQLKQQWERSGHTDVHALCTAFTFPKTHHRRRGSFLGDAATDGAGRLNAGALAE
jgi:hypothetical protein